MYDWAKAATKPNYTASEVGAIGYKGVLKDLGYTKLSDVTDPETYLIYDSNAFLTDWPVELTNDGFIYGSLIVHPAGDYITKTLIECNSNVSTVRPVYFFELNGNVTYKIGTIKDDLAGYLPLNGEGLVRGGLILNTYDGQGYGSYVGNHRGAYVEAYISDYAKRRNICVQNIDFNADDNTSVILWNAASNASYTMFHSGNISNYLQFRYLGQNPVTSTTDDNTAT